MKKLSPLPLILSCLLALPTTALAQSPDSLTSLQQVVEDPTSQPSPKTDTSKESIIDSKGVYIAVEQPAEFPGGRTALMSWLPQNIRYPMDAVMNKIQGRSVVRFIVEKDGSISDATIIQHTDPSLDAEALRVVRSMPNWIPAKNGGKPVRSYFTLPVSFRLSN